MARRNGGIVGKQNRTATAKASGIWAVSDNLESKKADNWPRLLFTGGNITTADVYTLGNFMTTASNMVVPLSGGTLTINGVSLGSYDYVTKVGNQTISAFTNSEWFTTTEDTRSAWIAINGNLTINSGQTLTPANRKLFTVIFVKGNLVVNGSISMTKRGANHSGTGNSGGSVTAGDILIKSGTYSGVANPKIPAAGGGGGAAIVNNGSGAVGTAGTAGGTGGGGSGGSYQEGGGSVSGAGAAGTAFTGGSGGGAVTIFATSAGSGVANGGAGGAGAGSYYGAGGGAGNPGGGGAGSGTTSGESGTGGVLIVICTGTISGAGTITAVGANGGAGSYNGKPDPGGTNAGASGGGSITIMYGSDTSSITPSAAGGVATVGSGATAGNGGNGGAGTARKLQL